jgi:hypothetical protein
MFFLERPVTVTKSKQMEGKWARKYFMAAKPLHPCCVNLLQEPNIAFMTMVSRKQITMITPLITQKQLTNLLTLIDALGISSRYA